MNRYSAEGQNGAIAIIGMSGRFPDARNVRQFWENLRNGVESIAFFSQEEMAAAGVAAETLERPDFVGAGGVLDDIDLFDALFFGFSASDAEIMDPQHRLFLECSWESLEDAGYNPESFEGSIGVYAGTSMSTYAFNIYASTGQLGYVDPMQVMLLNDKDHLTTHVSYKLNLSGPSIAVQSACSTSLVAVCMACDGLSNHRCDMALAGGVAISIPQRRGYLYQPSGILSPDGHCRAFDAAAQGTVAGNGVGIVVLKRLDDAISDRDHIYAVIRGAAVNNDGSLKVGYTAPSVEGQAGVIAMAHAIAQVEPETISYVEAHGTGTQLGDPIEIAALTQAFRARTEKTGFCAIGSVKTNVGHLDPAAGVAGLIKTALAIAHRELPPSLHFQTANPEIDFANSPFYVNTSSRAWRSNGAPLRAGVSSFGIGGTNAHCVLEEAPAIVASGPSRPAQLLLLSAKTKSALETQTANLAAFLREFPQVDLADVAYGYQIGRKAFGYRRMLVWPHGDVAGAAAALERRDPEQMLSNGKDVKERFIVFMFSGQGTQYLGMARELYETEITFRQQVDECCERLRTHVDFDLRQALYASESGTLTQTAVAQPALFTIEYALAKLWMRWGIQPHAMIGHSIGEYVAATLAGVLSFADAVKLVALRGSLMQRMPPGAMLAVPLSEEETCSLLGRKLSLAAINGPSACVISGPLQEVDQIERQLANRGVACRRLGTSHAFHSAMMDAAVARFVEQLRKVQFDAPKIPYVSNVTGSWITAHDVMDPEYWGRQLRQTVRFADGVHLVFQESGTIYLEVGPGHTLCTLVRQQRKEISDGLVLSSLPAAQEERSDVAFILKTLGQLWLSGTPVDWASFSADERRRRMSLPTYPFEGRRYWIGPPDKPESCPQRRSLSDWFYVPSWSPVGPSEALLQPVAGEAQRWLIFSDSCGLASEMAKELLSSGHDVTTIVAGNRFLRLDHGAYSIRPGERQDYDELMHELISNGRSPQQIAHCWLVDTPESSDPEVKGFWSLLYLAQALGKQTPPEGVQIGVFSNRLQRVMPEDTVSPMKAMALGPCRVIPSEYPNISCRCIDVVNDAPESLASLLIGEMTSELPALAVAYRQGARWVQNYEPIELERPSEEASLLKTQGVYLITGGLGGIGLALAQHLARSVKARLILVGRSGLLDRAEWQDWLAGHSDRDATSQKIRAIQAMEDLGAEIMVAAADVSDRRQMDQVIAAGTRRFAGIHGVIHSAGVAGGGMIQLKTLEIAAAVLAPKVKGMLLLHELFEGKQLDFVVICSSLASVYGGFGQVDYCAANNFLDYYAQSVSSPTRFTVSIGWDTWREVGMAVNTEVPPELQQSRQESLARGISPAEGAAVFSRILGARLPQVAVCTTDLQASLEVTDSLLAENGEVQFATVRTEHPRPALPNPYVAPRSDTEQILADLWQDFLGIKPVGIHDNFFELGGHSLLAIQMISKMRTLFEIDVSIQNLFDSPTVAKLAERVDHGTAEAGDLEIMARLLDHVEQLTDSEVRALLENGRQAG